MRYCLGLTDHLPLSKKYIYSRQIMQTECKILCIPLSNAVFQLVCTDACFNISFCLHCHAWANGNTTCNSLQEIKRSGFNIRDIQLHAYTSIHTSNFRDALYNMPYTIKMSFRYAVYYMSHFKRFSNLNITKNFIKKYCHQLHQLFHPNESTCFFSLKHKNKLQHTVENSIKIIQYLTYFSCIMCLLFIAIFFYFNWCTLIKQDY